jgi:hypothetical protein
MARELFGCAVFGVECGCRDRRTGKSCNETVGRRRRRRRRRASSIVVSREHGTYYRPSE